MSTTSSRGPGRVRGAFLGLAAVAAVVVPAAPAHAATTVGRFSTLPAGVGMGLDIDGVAVLTRSANGTTGRVVVRGLEAGVVYAAHLHKEACGFPGNPGGGHYMNVAGAGAAPPNELWFSSSDDATDGITVRRGGVGIGRGTADWVARDDARAVVIHAIPPGGTTAGGPKVACADLE